ncbi:glycosyl transferase [Nitrospira sp.]|nr:glycosyl transferase [Nitrospira sp.]
MGDLWAGAEVQLATLASELVSQPDLDLSAILFNEGRLASELRALKIPVAVFPETELSSVMLLSNMTAYCRTNSFDLLHAHKYKDTVVGAWAAARCGIPKMVRSVHGLGEPFAGLQALKMRVYQGMENAVIRWKVDQLIAVSTQIQGVLESQFGKDLVVQIHNGINIDSMHQGKERAVVRDDLGLKPTDCLVGCIGRLTAVKGQEHLLDAVKQLLPRLENLYVVIIGDGPLMGQLKSQAFQLGIGHRVRFMGHRDDTYDLMRAFDIFVLPSLHEGIPMVILEALALERPVVASRVGGIPEVIADGIQGLLVPAGDATAIARACERFLSDRALAESCGRAGRGRVEHKFSSRVMAEQVAQLYRSLTGPPPTVAMA